MVESAFGRPDETKTVAAVLAARAALVSLVAQVPPEHRERAWPIVGHILLSPVTLAGSLELLGLRLVSLAVAPGHQRRSVGARLVEAALRRARLLGYAYVVVLGPPSYFARLGFVPASHFGLSGSEPGSELLALELRPGALASASGIVRYPSGFSE